MAYDKKITIQTFSETTDNIGQKILTWATLCTPWASVNTIGGREYYNAAQVNAENDVVFKIRYSRSLHNLKTSDIRIVYGGNIYDIKHIDDFFEQHRELVIRTQQKEV